MLLSDGTNVMVERVDTFEIGGETLALEVAAVAEVDGDGKIKHWRDY
jgi:limonene-1,2-epoxide hydrolase